MHKVLASLVLAVLPVCASATELAGYLTLSSDYVRRGVSQSGGDPAVQLGGDLAFDSSIVLGAWGSTIDNPRKPGRQRDVELNTYIGYGYDIGDHWRFNGFAVAYFYPGLETPFDYDYVEYLISVNFDDRYWFELAYTPDLYGTDQAAWNAEVYAEWPLTGPWTVGGGIGHFDTSDVVGEDYAHWQFGATGTFQHAVLDLRYHDTDGAVPFLSTADTAKARLVLALTIPF